MKKLIIKKDDFLEKIKDFNKVFILINIEDYNKIYSKEIEDFTLTTKGSIDLYRLLNHKIIIVKCNNIDTDYIFLKSYIDLLKNKKLINNSFKIIKIEIKD